jgi:hypothetical protein
MRTTFRTAAVSANQGSGKTCTISGTTRHLNSTIAQCLLAIFPRKTWLRLVELTGLSERTAKYRMSGKRDFSASELAVLLRSEHGLDFLAAIMGEASPRWWVMVRSAFKLGAMRRHRQQLREAIDEAERLGDTLARAETALGVCDEDFHREQIDALGEIRRGLHRPLARRRED